MGIAVGDRETLTIDDLKSEGSYQLEVSFEDGKNPDRRRKLCRAGIPYGGDSRG